MRLRSTLLASFAVLGAFSLTVALIGGIALYRAGEKFDSFISGVSARSNAVDKIGLAVQERAIAARNMLLLTDPDNLKKQQQAAEATHAKVTRLLADYNTMVSQATDMSDEARALAQRINEHEASYAKTVLAVLRLAIEGETSDAVIALEQECMPKLEALMGDIHAYQGVAKQAVQVRQSEMSSLLHTSLVAMGLGAALSLVSAGALGIIVTRRTLRQLGADPEALGAAAAQVAGGDLRPLREVEHASPGSVMASMDAMRLNLADLASQLRAGADQIATAASEVSSGNQDLSSRTEQQASSLQQTAATMEQLGQTVQSNADSARRASDLAHDAAEVAGQGGQTVSEVVQTMRGINEGSRKIAEIIGVIDGIAFQTNILALNAAVEAARAGEQGRGFAVVAGEVRVLAQRSAQAAREIKGLIDASVNQVAQGSAQADRAGATMDDIVRSIRNVSSLVGEISQASTEQSEGVAQVGQAVTVLDQSTQQNAALVEQSAAAAESLQQQAQAMRALVGRFRTEAA